MMTDLRFNVAAQSDVEHVRRATRELARAAGFNRDDAELVVLAVLELATNLVRYAQTGELTLRTLDSPKGRGIEIESRDTGPGIPDVTLALQDGYSTGGGLGSGLPSTRRMMDDFEITSSPEGTRIVARKWLRT